MNVREAIEILQNADPDTEVFVSSDEEGNSYRHAEISLGQTLCDQYGELVSCHPKDIEDGEYEGWEDQMMPAVVFW